MELSLYQITNAFPQIMENEEITEEDKAKLQEELGMLLAKKSENIIGYTRNEELTIEALKQEEDRLKAIRKQKEDRLAKFKDYVKDCMESHDIKKVDTNLGSLTIAKNPISVEVIDETKVPEEYKKVEMKVTVDKKKLIDNFKNTGEVIDGVSFNTEKTSLRIK